MLNLGGVQKGHLTLTMTAEEYLSQMGQALVPTHNPGDYPPVMGTAQKKALGPKRFRQNQSLFRRYTTVDGAIKNQIFTAMQPLFLYPLMHQLKGFGQVTALHMMKNLFSSYGLIEKINLRGKTVNIMGPYNPVEPLARIID